MKKILIFTLAFLLLSLASFAQFGVKGNGNVVKQTRETSQFDKIEVEKAVNVFLRKGNESRIVVVADENLIPLIKTSVSNGNLKISTSKNIQKAKKLEIYVEYEDIKSVLVTGASDLIAEGIIKANAFNLEVSGASDATLSLDVNELDYTVSGASDVKISGEAKKMNGKVAGASDINLTLEVDELNCEVSGASDVKLSGKATQMNLKISGASDVTAKEFRVKNAYVNMSGGSSANVYVSQELIYSESGGSDLNFQGTAEAKKIEGNKKYK